jgi:uncharacterized membrane protein YuzA (DUF378 family)
MNTLYSLTFIVTCLGAIQWGLIGIGGFMGKNINAVAFLSRGNSTLEYVIYLIIGICAIVHIWLSSHN